MSSLVHPFYPRHCPQCGMRFNGLFDHLSHTCPTRDPYAYRYGETNPQDEEETKPEMPAITYEGKCSHCGGSMYRNARGSLHSCGIKIPFSECGTAQELPAVTAGEFEEVTPAHAALFYQHALQNALDHIKSCTTCRYLAKDDSVCDDMKRLRRICEKWLVLKTASR